MTALVAIETVVLALLAVLVVGLLRSHADILRRLRAIEGSSDVSERPGSDPGHSGVGGGAGGGGGAGPGGPGAVPEEPLPEPRERNTPAYDIAGENLRGDAVQVAVAGGGADTLLAFLSSGCGSCLDMWGALGRHGRGELPRGARLVVVTKDPSHESRRKLRELAPSDVTVVMSSATWTEYDVPHSPYFIFVDGRSGEIAGEGSARQWDQVLSLLGDALDDEAANEGFPEESRGALEERPRPILRRDSDGDVRRADEELRQAGIRPGHPSLSER